MNQIWFALMTIAFLIVVCFLVYVLLELREISKGAHRFSEDNRGFPETCDGGTSTDFEKHEKGH